MPVFASGVPSVAYDMWCFPAPASNFITLRAESD
nr:MAG TPA: hypothetical protein [Caudoviricetes sp.]